MIRQILNQEITNLANQVLPNAVSDKWLSTDFTVLFPKGLEFLQPAYSDDSQWLGIAIIRGSPVIRILTNDKMPIDPTPLVAALFEAPIIVEPDPTLIEAGDMTVQFKFLPTGIQDILTVDSVIAVLSGYLEGHLLKRLADVTTYTHEDIGNVADWLYKG
jgi:hypothetical protein